MSETGIKEWCRAPSAAKQGEHASTEQISKSEHINISVCPECGGPLQLGSRDPCEGDYYWCPGCGAGPILFPLGTGPRPVSPIIDAECANAALRTVAALKSRGYPGGVFAMAHAILEREGDAAYRRSE